MVPRTSLLHCLRGVVESRRPVRAWEVSHAAKAPPVSTRSHLPRVLPHRTPALIQGRVELTLLARISHQLSDCGRRCIAPSGVFSPRGARRTVEYALRAPQVENPAGHGASPPSRRNPVRYAASRRSIWISVKGHCRASSQKPIISHEMAQHRPTPSSQRPRVPRSHRFTRPSDRLDRTHQFNNAVRGVRRAARGRGRDDVR